MIIIRAKNRSQKSLKITTGQGRLAFEFYALALPLDFMPFLDFLYHGFIACVDGGFLLACLDVAVP